MDAQQRWYRESLKLRGAVVADVGANVGALSQFFFDAVGPKGKVVSIEPVPGNIKAIDKRIRKAGAKAKGRWQLKKCAASDSIGKVSLRVLRTDWGTNSMVTANEDGDLIDVDCRPLADLVPDATVVKMDIEGHEYQVLPHALVALPKVHSYALELHCMKDHPLEDTLAQLVEAGFSLFAAGRKRDSPQGDWLGVPVTPKLSWNDIPGTKTQHDGIPGLFKMLHLLAKR